MKGTISTRANYSEPKNIFYKREEQSSGIFFYDRYENNHRDAVDLPVLKLREGTRKVKVSDDFRQRICVQYHAPNAFHKAGTSDDRTPWGVHEGLSCLSCHQNHSNEARQSCVYCHPAISNCGLDVTKMNTNF
jgi:hypothetical protein